MIRASWRYRERETAPKSRPETPKHFHPLDSLPRRAQCRVCSRGAGQVPSGRRVEMCQNRNCRRTQGWQSHNRTAAHPCVPPTVGLRGAVRPPCAMCDCTQGTVRLLPGRTAALCACVYMKTHPPTLRTPQAYTMLYSNYSRTQKNKKQTKPTCPCLVLLSDPPPCPPPGPSTGRAPRSQAAHLQVLDGHSRVGKEALAESDLDSSFLHSLLEVVQSLGWE